MEAVIRKKFEKPDIPTTFSYEWNLLKNRLELHMGDVHIWKVDLNAENSQEDYKKILSIDEQIRAERIIFPKKREKFRSARSALRKILSIYMRQLPESINFEYGENGKPYLLQASQRSPINFNIAHSDDLMVAAFTKGISVGIDLELIQPISTRNWIVKQYFSRNDQTIFQNIPEKDKKTAFINAWTIKEAYGKAMGFGLASPSQLNHFKPGLITTLPACHYEMVLDDSFWLLRFTPAEKYIATAAILTGDKPKPYFWEFSGMHKST